MPPFTAAFRDWLGAALVRGGCVVRCVPRVIGDIDGRLSRKPDPTLWDLWKKGGELRCELA
jgi:hypothetical protein